MQYQTHKNAKLIFKEIGQNKKQHLIMHYSCESFYNIIDDKSSRITSIAIYSLDSSQTNSFSIHKCAEREQIDMRNIEKEYDKLEKSMLSDFFKFVEKHENVKWIHWNMRDINFGFQAIEHRFEVLGGKPYYVNNSNKINLSELLIDCYGANYISHPRMEKLIELNNISTKDFLTGEEEAEAFNQKEYIKLHFSTLRKVDIFSNIIYKQLRNQLKVNSKWKDIYGISIQGIYETLNSQWWFGIFAFFLGILINNLFF